MATQYKLSYKGKEIDDRLKKIDLLEETTNKVTSINKNSTDIQYPSAKAVCDFVMANGSETGEESYRFLKTITVTEEVEEISETFPVDYDGVIVTVENISLASGNLQLYVTAGKDWTLRGAGASLKTNSVMRFICRKLNGTWDVFGYQGLSGDASTMIGQIAANAVSAVSDTAPEGFAAGFDNINKIRVYSYSGYTLPVGMTIKIFVLGGDDNA